MSTDLIARYAELTAEGILQIRRGEDRSDIRGYWSSHRHRRDIGARILL